MKPPLFHVGQAVVCILTHWVNKGQGEEPRKGPVYHVMGMEPHRNPGTRNGDWCYWLAELDTPDSVCEAALAPVEYASDEALAELLEEAFTPVTA